MKYKFLKLGFGFVLWVMTLSISYGQVIFTASGVGNTFTVSVPSVSFPAVPNGVPVHFISNQLITGPAFLNLNGQGPISIKKEANKNLDAGDIKNGQAVMVVFDGGNFQLLSGYPSATVSGVGGMPEGSIIAYAGATIPAGWLLCDGTAYSRTGVYSALFAAIGTAWGNGNGTTTFNVPDLRGMFLRGVDGTAGRDPDKASRVVSTAGGNTGNIVGSAQLDEFKGHNHSIPNMKATPIEYAAGNVRSTYDYYLPNIFTTGNSGGNETRPKNAYVNYIIKY